MAPNPAPGFTTSATTTPMNSAKVDTASKYSSAFTPTRPTFRRSPMEEMPCTMVQKITGAIIILMSATKASPSHCMDFAVSGAT